MGICVMPVRALLDYIFEDYETFAKLPQKEQEVYWNVIESATDGYQFECIMQYHQHRTNAFIRIRAEDAQELHYLLQED